MSREATDSMMDQENLVDQPVSALEHLVDQPVSALHVEDQVDQPVSALEDLVDQPVSALEHLVDQPVSALEDLVDQPVSALEDLVDQPVSALHVEDQVDQPVSALEDLVDQPVSALEYDDLFNYVSSFGRYQKVVFFASCLLVLMTAMQFAALLFVFGTPNFHCDTPGNYSTCPPNKCCANCTSYVFDGPFRSVVSEWNLICDKAYVGATLQACFYGGMLVGSTLSGTMADSIGRKKTTFLCIIILIVPLVCSFFAYNISLLGILRFFVGFGAAGNQSSHFTFVLELLGPNHRSMVSTMYIMYFTVGIYVFILFAYLVRGWRHLLLMSSLPGLLLFLFVRVYPESPRWLLSKSKLNEAENILVKFGSATSKPLDRIRLRKAIQDVSKAQFSNEKIKQEKIYTPLDLVRTPKLRKRSFFLAINWFSVSFLGNAFFLYVGNLAGDIYLNFFIINAIMPVAIVATGYFLKRAGRRPTHAGVLIIIGVLSLGSLGVPSDQPLTRTWIFVAASVVGIGMWVTIFLLGTELFPTVLRSTAVGTGYTIGRFGAIIAPYVGILGQLPGLTITLPLTIFGAIAIATSITVLWLPETLNSKMHQTIEEEERAEEDYGILYCGKRKADDVNQNTHLQDATEVTPL